MHLRETFFHRRRYNIQLEKSDPCFTMLNFLKRLGQIGRWMLDFLGVEMHPIYNLSINK